MIKKKKKTWKLVVSLILMSLVLVVSVGGLTIINGANANENISFSETNLDVVEKSNIIVSDYVTDGGSSSGNKEVVKIETVEQAIVAVNQYLNNNAYVCTSTGNLNIWGTVDNVLKEQSILDLGYYDYFEHEVGGRAYWEEGFKLKKFYNSFIESLFNTYSTATDYYIEQYNRIYFVDNNEHYSQFFEKPNFAKDFKVDQKLINNTQIIKNYNTDKLRENKYADRYFRWDINENSVKNGSVSKRINGYQFEFDLDIDTGARDVYYRWVRWSPKSIISNIYPGAYHYVINFDRYGNVVSFYRNESINMEISNAITGLIQLNFAFKYSFKTKNSDYKIQLDNVFTTELTKLGYLN